MYIEKVDYKIRIDIDLFNMLLEEDETAILADCSQIAEDTLVTYLGMLYDIKAELAKIGTARNAYIKSLALSIALYEVYQRADDDNVPHKVIKNYEDAINDLRKISYSKRSLNIPPAPVPNIDININNNSNTNGGNEQIITQQTGTRRMGSQAKRSHTV